MELTPSETDFVEKYRRLCGHIAWDFVRRSKREISSIVLTQEDAEDFACIATMRLIRAWRMGFFEDPKRCNQGYITRIIENEITTAWRKRLRQMGMELDHIALAKSGLIGSYDGRDGQAHENIWDKLPGPDGLAGKTQVKFDYARVSSLLPTLSDSERLVIQFSFAIDGCQQLPIPRIARKLGRTDWWVKTKCQSGLAKIRQQLSAQSLPAAV